MKKDHPQTPSQTVGPYFAYGLTAEQYKYDNTSITGNLLKSNTEGQQIIIRGKILDGNGVPISDAMIEVRQDASLEGFGRMGTGTEADNSYIFYTVKPRPKDNIAPHINVIVMMRGLLSHVLTRIYFSDEDNSTDSLLTKVSKDRQHTLIAQRKVQNGQIVYEFDIHMQGENETVFFDA